MLQDVAWNLVVDGTSWREQGQEYRKKIQFRGALLKRDFCGIPTYWECAWTRRDCAYLVYLIAFLESGSLGFTRFVERFCETPWDMQCFRHLSSGCWHSTPSSLLWSLHKWISKEIEMAKSLRVPKMLSWHTVYEYIRKDVVLVTLQVFLCHIFVPVYLV